MEAVSPDADSDSSVDGGPSPVAAEMSEESALKKIDEDGLVWMRANSLALQ
jgi:hypothetical protein